MNYVKTLRERPMAIETATANSQHYEVGTGVLKSCLGPRMKYSCCLYPTGTETLGQAEIEMLETYIERAGLSDGTRVLDLGYVKFFPKKDDLLTLTLEMWVGVWCSLLCRNLSQFPYHSFFKFEDPESIYRWASKLQRALKP